MSAQDTSPKLVQFGTFELDLHRGELRKQGVKIKLQEQPLKVLQLLLDNPGEIISREQLRSHVWPANTFVEFDQSLYSAMARLRDALGDTSESPRFVETVARRGYRFIAPVAVPTFLADSSFYFYMGRQYDRAIEQGQKALQLDPNCYTCRTYVALSEVQKGQFREATQEIDPVKFPEAAPIDVATTISILALAGETARATSLQKSLQVQMTQRYVCPYEVATGFTALGKKDDAFKWLQKSYEAHSICVIWLNSEPRFDPLRSDPRFAALVRQVGLPERK